MTMKNMLNLAPCQCKYYTDKELNKKVNKILCELHDKISQTSEALDILMHEDKVSMKQASMIRDKINIVHCTNYVLLTAKLDFFNR